ncbi:MAG: NepR family anti-sigma factor [Novosphingobium sp.]
MAKKDTAKDNRMISAAAAPFDSVSAALRSMHDSVTAEPVPDDFLSILDEIDAKIAAGKRIQ